MPRQRHQSISSRATKSPQRNAVPFLVDWCCEPKASKQHQDQKTQVARSRDQRGDSYPHEDEPMDEIDLTEMRNRCATERTSVCKQQAVCAFGGLLDKPASHTANRPVVVFLNLEF
jgi:hypothetical protein